jgi:hypothetical protein
MKECGLPTRKTKRINKHNPGASALHLQRNIEHHIERALPRSAVKVLDHAREFEALFVARIAGNRLHGRA